MDLTKTGRLIAEKSASPDGIILSETERRDLE